jgi:hypothetical protein
MRRLTAVALLLATACARGPAVPNPATMPATIGTRGATVLVPAAGVLHGAGQSPDAFAAYWSAMEAARRPAVYMTYIGLDDSPADWGRSLRAELAAYPEFLIPQVGLAMTNDSSPSTHYEQVVAAGGLDGKVDQFVAALADLGRPAYVRIGYEFNGRGWNGYEPDSYKQAFVRVTQRIRAARLQVATVWDASPDGDRNFMPFYPGDDVVDWWGINLFSPEHMSDPWCDMFVRMAGVHGKPVMIGESTPRGMGVLGGQSSWDRWFAPYFGFIHAHPEIKLFSYINWNWGNYPQWSTWGDARVEANAVVRGLYVGEMADPLYLHAGTETEMRARLGAP